MIVLDDLKSTSARDPRIIDLFTEGSHHRNLSVVVLNQNLYFSKDPTQRRNCHYLVLFNNPVDKQQIMTLGRQMYPGKGRYFIGKFEESTSKPYGYLLLDLKPTTLESKRLLSNVFQQQSPKNNEAIPTSKRIKAKQASAVPYSYKNYQSEQTYETIDTTEETWDKKYDKYVKEGMNKEDAFQRCTSNSKITPLVKQQFFKRYTDLLKLIVPLEESGVHYGIVRQIQDAVDDDKDYENEIGEFS
ncbi:unnamed protein product [Mytilus coruscus]|uniref:Uncharacterized protein n=1 Tax=Mytilus coruscus TaxID=42192 RepID=A0A6J8DCD0_MYTCO|nr:unnamed protein product [Mytilus coruscus]